MATPKRLTAARRHGRRAVSELRHLSADAALYWVLSHRTRVAQLRRAVKGTRAASAFDGLLEAIREQATPMPRPRARPAARPAAARRRRTRVQRRITIAKPPRWLRDIARRPLPL